LLFFFLIIIYIPFNYKLFIIYKYEYNFYCYHYYCYYYIYIYYEENINTESNLEKEIFKRNINEDLNKYYRSFRGTFQKFKPMAIPSPELCATINNRYQNNINIQEFFEHIETITTQNAGLLSSSLSSLANLVHGNQDSQEDIRKAGTLRKKKLLNPNTGDAGLSKTYRSYFKFAKKKVNTKNEVFVSNIPSNSIPIPNIEIPDIPSSEELASRDPLSLGIYYHNHKQYDIADYYFTLSSADSNAIGLYIHGMYLKYGHGISGCSPDLGFQYLLKSAEASIQSIPTANNNNNNNNTNNRIASTDGEGVNENEQKKEVATTSINTKDILGNKEVSIEEESPSSGKGKLEEDQQNLLVVHKSQLNDIKGIYKKKKKKNQKKKKKKKLLFKKKKKK